MNKTLFLVLLLFASCQKEIPKSSPPSVTVEEAKRETVFDKYSFISITESILKVDVVSKVSGYIAERVFVEGSDVKQGDLLYIIDQRPFKAAFLEAEGQKLRIEAELKDAEIILQRQTVLEPQGFASRERFDNATAKRDALLAELVSAEAMVENARLNLEYTEIISPIDGRIGRAYFNKGDFASPTAGVLADIVILDPIRVIFAIPSDRVLEERLGTGDDLRELQDVFKPVLMLPNQKTYKQKGSIEFVDNKVDVQTSSIAVFALFENPDKLLLPGQYLNIEIDRTIPDEVLTVPISAVQQDSKGFFVYVLDEGDIVRLRRVETGRQLEKSWVITKGLKEGDKVVVLGIQKIKDGQKVSVGS